jgi:DNA-binding SARP family transcriptional activator
MGGDRALELRLLGPLEASRDGQAVALGGSKPRALLAVLALDLGRVVSVDRLVEALWPGDPPDSAGHAVQVYVSQLRKALGPVIATRPPGYVLELERESVDLHVFSRLADEARDALQAGSPETAEASLRDALALWRGPALADFAYEPFAQNEIARLEELRTAVLEERIETDLALGRHVELVWELEAVVQAHPLRERPRGQLMLALYRSGRQADALAAYRAARETLLDELGLDPGPELKELEAAILRQDESLLLDVTPLARPPMQFRRLVTILFCDVVESMALAAALDAEALGRVLQSYFETVSAAITRHGGAVEKYAGDAVMAAFGIPISHEDDALRAARAALDIRAGLRVLNERLLADFGVSIVVRIGLEAGEVVATPTDARQRLVTGEAVGIAAKLEQAAADDEIVVGEVAARLIDHAAHLEPLGALEIKGKQEPVNAYRLRELAPVGPAFEGRLDASLVGRKRELAALRRALKRAIDSGSARAKVVIGPPGAGKSRLVAEFSRRTKGVTTLRGRCLSYGEGITYWPLREVLAGAPESEERDAVLAALDAETPPPEIAWLFRRFCEDAARERPLVVVLDDVHWAEPTFLELVEHLVGKGEAPILVVCIAREELLEDRAEFLDGLPNADRIVLDALSADETDALLDGLGGTVLESDQRERIVATAEGNPFFLEQLLALALEGGLVERELPETVQALLAARLDRLGPGERAVLERGAVIGKEFRLDDVAALLEPEAAPTAEVHMQALSARGFVRPADPGQFRFRHVLVQEAVYRAAPKRLRAELHERFIDRFEGRDDGTGDVDEFAGYHLERAYRLRTELGESDRRTQTLAEDAGRRLGEAGVRALKRGDMSTTVNLLDRAVPLVPEDHALRRLLLCELGIAMRASGNTDGALSTLTRAISEARDAGDRQMEMRARLEHAYLRLLREPATTARPIRDVVAEGVPVFEAVGDYRSLARAWLLDGFVLGAHLGRHEASAQATHQALEYYRQSRWPTATCLGQIAVALYYGPTPVSAAIGRCEELLASVQSDGIACANIDVFRAGLIAQRGDFDEARDHVGRAIATYEDHGQRSSAAVYAMSILGEIALLGDDVIEAERILRELCSELERTQAFSHLATRAGELAEALLALERLDEAEEWTRVGELHTASDDLDAQLVWKPVRAKVAARRGLFEEAEALVCHVVEWAEESDALNRRAKALSDLGEVLRLMGSTREAASAFEQAIGLYERKGNLVGVRRTRALQGDVALV